MLDIAALFGEKESMTLSEMTEALKGRKLVDLTDGGYISEEKFRALEKSKDAKITELSGKITELEGKQPKDDGLEAVVAELKSKLETVQSAQSAAEAKALRLEREKIVAAKVTNPKLAKLAMIEAEQMVSDEVSFDDALAKLIESDPDYTAAASTEEPDTGSKMRSGEPSKGAPVPTDKLKSAIDSAFGGADTKE